MSRFSPAMPRSPARRQPQSQAIATHILILDHDWEHVLAGATFGSLHAGECRWRSRRAALPDGFGAVRHESALFNIFWALAGSHVIINHTNSWGCEKS